MAWKWRPLILRTLGPHGAFDGNLEYHNCRLSSLNIGSRNFHLILLVTDRQTDRLTDRTTDELGDRPKK